MAVGHRFLGSPTVWINSVDIDPNLSDRDEYGLSCRLYQAPNGLVGAPPDEWMSGRCKGQRKTEVESPDRRCATHLSSRGRGLEQR
jgi:hypothetical protein